MCAWCVTAETAVYCPGSMGWMQAPVLCALSQSLIVRLQYGSATALRCHAPHVCIVHAAGFSSFFLLDGSRVASCIHIYRLTDADVDEAQGFAFAHITWFSRQGVPQVESNR